MTRGFSPTGVSAEAAGFARRVVHAVQPVSAARAKALLFAVSRLGAYGLSVGLPLEAEVLLSDPVIERACVSGLSSHSPATVRTVRANLRYVADRVLPSRARPARIPRERAKPPYSGFELAAYVALARAQTTPSRRHRALSYICLGAGAGLVGSDLREVRGLDVVSRSGGVLVEVHGRRERAVPVRRQFHDDLLAAASFAGDRYLTGGSEPQRRNLTNPLSSSLAGGIDLAPLDGGRLRSTWLRACAGEIGLRAFLDAAGVASSQRLGDIVAGLEAPQEREAVVLLEGRG